jgi:2-hydroxychromene-2-carboxylate isomerase
MSTTSVERINVNFPSPVLEDLRRLVPAKRRSEVIARATARELRRIKLAVQFEQTARRAVWSDEKYPALGEPNAIDAALTALRLNGAPFAASVIPPTPRKRGQRE